MAASGRHAPFMCSVTATTTAQSLAALIATVYSDIGAPGHACFLQVQLDISAAGGILYGGNSNVSSTMCGFSLVASQISQTLAFDSNLLDLADIYLRASAGELQVNLIVLKR